VQRPAKPRSAARRRVAPGTQSAATAEKTLAVTTVSPGGIRQNVERFISSDLRARMAPSRAGVSVSSRVVGSSRTATPPASSKRPSAAPSAARSARACDAP
jgi:hypothetical protein